MIKKTKKTCYVLARAVKIQLCVGRVKTGKGNICQGEYFGQNLKNYHFSL